MRSHRTTAVTAALFVLLSAASAFAQGVGINGTGAAADTSALLDLSSTAKGFLAPRMTALQRAAITLPATGLLVYQTDGTAGLYCNTGSALAPAWMPVGVGGGAGQWTTSGSSLYYNGGRVGVGTPAPGYRFTAVDTGLVLRVQANNAGSTMASFGGAGSIVVDAPGVVGGRLSLLDSGYLGLGRVTPTARLDVLGGNWDVVGGEGDVRIGDDATRLKFGIALGGGGTGAATIMEQGAPGAYNVLALGTQGNKVLFVNGNSQRIGIGVDLPTAPLGFAAALGKKITLYPGASGDAGFGIAGNRLQIYADNPNADVALGYDVAGTFNERFAVKPTGALAVSGQVGTAGQVLQSNGSAAATWVSPTNAAFNNVYQAAGTAGVSVNPGGGEYAIPGLTQTFSVTGNAKVLVSFNVPCIAAYCLACGPSNIDLFVKVDGVNVFRNTQTMANTAFLQAAGTVLVTVTPGTHTIGMFGFSSGGTAVLAGNGSLSAGSGIVLQVMQQ